MMSYVGAYGRYLYRDAFWSIEYGGPFKEYPGKFFYFVHIKIIFYYVLYFLTFVLILDKYMFGWTYIGL